MSAPLVHPVTGVPLKLGRVMPAAIHRRRMHLPLSRYLLRTAALPPLPEKTNWREKAAAILSECGLNSDLSDCTTEGAFHSVGVWRANTGRPFAPTNAERTAFYSGSTGYVPGRPDTDQGGDEITVMDYWRDHGLIAGADKILCHLSVDATNPEELCYAIALAANLYFGMAMPGDWLGKFMPAKNGAVWPIAGDPVPENGHAFNGVDYSERYRIVGISSEGIIICTWGILVLIPWNAIAKYGVPSAGGEVHVAISEDWLLAATSKTPSGLNLAQLKADVALIASAEA